MLTFECLDLESFDWDEFKSFPEHTPFQTRAWMRFLQNTQHGEPVLAEIRDGSCAVGYFIGMVVRKFGLKFLGSPFPGWTTCNMGFALHPGVSRSDAARALVDFAFHQLGCVHLEIIDRQLQLNELSDSFDFRLVRGFEIDLTLPEDRLLANMHSSYRRCISKAIRCGLAVEESDQLAFADEYYAQLYDVFGKQGLVPTYDLERVRELIKCVLPEGMLLLLRARDPNGVCIATNISIGLDDQSYFWGGASFRKSQILRPNQLLQWHAMKYWKAHGCRFLDLNGGGDFKRRYGARENVLPWFRKSRYQFLPVLREAARRFVWFKLQVAGRYKRHSLGTLEPVSQDPATGSGMPEKAVSVRDSL